MKKNMTKILVVALAVAMVALASVSATLAWLYDTDESEENVFTVGKVYIELTEDEPELQVVPGEKDTKRPQVTVIKGSEKAYVFIKIDEDMGDLLVNGENGTTYDFGDYVTYALATGWEQVPDTTDVWYQIVDVEAADAHKVIDVLAADVNNENQISYSEDITNAMLAPVQTGVIGIADDGSEIMGGAGEKPTLTFTAYAIQHFGFATEKDAWAELVTTYSIN